MTSTLVVSMTSKNQQALRACCENFGTSKNLEIFSGMEKYLRRSLSCSDIEGSVHRTVAPVDLPDRIKKCVMACLIVSLYTCHDVDHAVEKTMLCLHELGTIKKSAIQQ